MQDNIFNIDNVMIVFPNSELSIGTGKFGTTAARVLRNENFWVIESPRYDNGIKCWITQPNSYLGKEVICQTIYDFCSILDENNIQKY